jgi:hypothetical protein
MQKRKMRKIENLVYLSQIDSHDIFLYYDHVLPAIEWLNEQGYQIQSWEAFLETKNGIVRTLDFGNNQDSPIRGLGKNVAQIRNEIEVAIKDWSRNSNNSRLIISLNLKNALSPKIHLIPVWSRIAAALLGFASLGVLGVFSYAYFNSEMSFEGMVWSGPVSALICAPLFLYAAFTGKGDIRFLSSENYFKRRTKNRIKTETGQLRWSQNA